MTLLEKIKNYKWFDSPNKLRAILEELYNSIGGGSGGGSQDLQSVLDNGGQVILENGDNSVEINIEATPSSSVISLETFGISRQTSYSSENGDFYLRSVYVNSLSTVLSFEIPVAVNTGAQIKIPAKPEGTYTLATLDDIKKIDLTDRVYANNATAISGGLTANDIYRTSTGELRIVV
jgi:hypothetical protein